MAKTQAFVGIDACIKGHTFAVLRRPTGFGMSALASTVCEYYDVSGYNGPSWPYPTNLDPDHLHGFLVFHLDFLALCIDPKDPDSFLTYLRRMLRTFIAKYKDVIPKVNDRYKSFEISFDEILALLVSRSAHSSIVCFHHTFIGGSVHLS